MKKKVRIIFLLFLCVHLGYLCFLGTKKINFHIDEYFTYALSNKEDDNHANVATLGGRKRICRR